MCLNVYTSLQAALGGPYCKGGRPAAASMPLNASSVLSPPPAASSLPTNDLNTASDEVKGCICSAVLRSRTAGS